MEQRLKLVFQDPHLALACKAVLFAAALALIAAADFSMVAIFAGAVGVVYLYRRQGNRHVRMRSALGILFVISLSLAYLLPEFDIRFLLYLGAAGVFYVMLSLREFLFVRRSEWNYALRLLISYLIFLLVLLLDITTYFLLVMIPVFLVLYVLWKEFFRAMPHSEQMLDEHNPRALASASALIALIVTESLWLGKLLPFGIIHAANFSFLTAFVCSSLVVRHLEHRLKMRYILWAVTFFVCAMVVSFAVSRWSI